MKVLAQALIVLPLILLLGQCTVEFFAVDACLDAGNVYDYTRGLCRSDITHLPYVPYLERSWLSLVAAAASIISGVAVLVIANRKAS